MALGARKWTYYTQYLAGFFTALTLNTLGFAPDRNLLYFLITAGMTLAFLVASFLGEKEERGGFE